MKKIIFFLVACLLSAALPNGLVFAETMSENGENKYTEEINFLSELKIIEGVYSPDENISRSELALILMKMMGSKAVEAQAPQKAEFTDVPAEHIAAGAISQLVKLGIMNGFWDGKFRPDDNVTAVQAAKSLVSLTGYNIIAEQNGGYPTGYWLVATQKNILRSLHTDMQQQVKKGELAKMLYNALTIDIMSEGSVVGGEIQYENVQGKNLLTENFDVYLERGIIAATSVSSLYSGIELVGKNCVVISGVSYSYDKFNLEQYLGYDIKFYYQDDKKDLPKIIFVFDVNATNDITVINSSDIISVQNRKITYFKNSAAKSYEISRASDIIVNGRLIEDYSESLIDVPLGSISIIDKGDDMDLISVSFIAEYIVSSVNKSNETIYGKYGNVKLETKTSGVKANIKRNGSAIQVGDLSAWDVLEIAVDSMKIDGSIDGINANYISGDVTTETISGTVSEVSTDGIKIGEKEYQYSKTFSKIAENPNIDAELPIVGKPYQISLNSKKEIAAIKEDTSTISKRYGVLMAVAVSSSVGAKTEIKLFSSDGKEEIYTLPEKLKIDGVSSCASKIMLNKWEQLKTTEGEAPNQVRIVRPENRLIAYSLNSEGIIAEIDTLLENAVSTKDELKMGPYIPGTGDAQKYKGGAMGTSFLLNAGTIKFVYPKYPDQDIDDIENYEVGDTAFVEATEYEWFRNVYSYDAAEDNLVKAVATLPKYVNTNASINIDAKLSGGFVLKILDAIDEDSNPCKKVYFLSNSGSISNVLVADMKDGINPLQCVKNPWLDNEKTIPKLVQQGDYIRYSVNAQGKLSGVEIALRTADLGEMPYTNIKKNGNPVEFGNQYYIRVAYGQAYYKNAGLVVAKKAARNESGQVVYDYNDPDTSFDTYNIGSTKILKYKPNEKSITRMITSAFKDDILSYKEFGGSATMIMHVSFDANSSYIMIFDTEG